MLHGVIVLLPNVLFCNYILKFYNLFYVQNFFLKNLIFSHFHFFFSAIEHLYHVSKVQSFQNREDEDVIDPNFKQSSFSDVIAILKLYRELKIPNVGQSIKINIPAAIHPISFSRSIANDEEDHFICDWSLPITFYSLPKKQIFRILSACLLEKRICKFYNFF